MSPGSLQPMPPVNSGHFGAQEVGLSTGTIIEGLSASRIASAENYRAAVTAPSQLPSSIRQGPHWPHVIVRRTAGGLLHQPALTPFESASIWMSTQWPGPPQEKAQDEEMAKRVANASVKTLPKDAAGKEFGFTIKVKVSIAPKGLLQCAFHDAEKLSLFGIDKQSWQRAAVDKFFAEPVPDGGPAAIWSLALSADKTEIKAWPFLAEAGGARAAPAQAPFALSDVQRLKASGFDEEHLTAVCRRVSEVAVHLLGNLKTYARLPATEQPGTSLSEGPGLAKEASDDERWDDDFEMPAPATGQLGPLLLESSHLAEQTLHDLSFWADEDASSLPSTDQRPMRR